MIDRIMWADTENTYPYGNLAMGEYMTIRVLEGTCILFLWQNRHTVVIGRNQNCWSEYRVNFLEEEGGCLIRRLSDGGAVFHDLGNSNFTFIVKKKNYDVSRQLGMILEAVRSLGLKAEETGCNDITADGHKFSGNAFYHSSGCCYHHGTVLLNADKEYMSRYLNVPKEKLASRGVSFIKAGVANLCEFCPGLTMGGMKKALAGASSRVYGLEAERMYENSLPEDEIGTMTGKSKSWKQEYGREIPFKYEMGHGFFWGGVQMQLHMDEGKIWEVNVFSDAMEQGMIGDLAVCPKGCPYNEAAVCGGMKKVDRARGEGAKVSGIITLVKEYI